MNVKHLEYILAIAENHNMTKAAEELFVSQSSLSQYLSRLENELGTPLFIRSKNELTLTTVGEMYVETAKEIVKLQKELYHNISSLSQQGHISVGVTSNFGLRMLSEIIPIYKDIYPDMSIEISETNLPGLKKLLSNKSINIGIAADINSSIFDGNAHILRKEEVLFAIPSSHKYAAEHPSGSSITSNDINDIKNFFLNDNFFLSKKGSSLRMLSDQFFDSFDFDPSAYCETNSISTTRRMIAQNTGVAFIAESCSVDRDFVSYYSLTPPIYRLNLAICQKDWIMNKSEQVFFDLILNYFTDNKEKPYFADKYAV